MPTAALSSGPQSITRRNVKQRHDIPQTIAQKSTQIANRNQSTEARQSTELADLSDPTSESPDDSSKQEENYDDLKPDPFAVVGGSKGAGIEVDGQTMAEIQNGTLRARIAEDDTVATVALKQRKGSRKSIQLVVEPGSKKGRYILTADDPEIRDMLRNSIEREATGSNPSKRPYHGFRELVFTRRFTTFDRQNPLSSGSPFHGFFTLFWLALGLLLTKVAAHNWRAYGSLFGRAELLHMMFERDIIVLGLTDGLMCGATIFGLGLQKLVLHGWLSWSRTGWIIQNLWQTTYLFAVVAWTWYREWPWTHTIFVVLHCLVFIMKQHSYAFYNGYLSQVYRRKRILQEKLAHLDHMTPLSSPVKLAHIMSAPAASAVKMSNGDTQPSRRLSIASKSSTNLDTERSDIAKISAAIDAGKPLNEDQMDAFGRVMRNEINALSTELRGKSTDGSNAYPKNLTVVNWADWICLPTLVYELEYPRQEKINWWYVAEKTAATFGVIWVMMVVSQAYIYPAVVETVRMKDAGMTLEERWREFPWIVSDMLFPLLLEQLLSWYVIWECCLNVLAELTRFADRGFYGDWWNSTSWDQYARDWNRPVHSFLLRHVYHSSISAFHLSKGTATFVTFFLSACVHELLMFCLFKKVRGYLFAMQLAQLPLAMLSRTKLLKGRDLLGNVLFWFGLFVGPSLITSLYLIV